MVTSNALKYDTAF